MIESPQRPSERRSEAVRQFDIRRVKDGEAARTLDSVAVEEPLEIRLEYSVKDLPRQESIAIAMRTPGADRELAAGFLLTEGVIRDRSEIADVRYIGSQDRNEIVVELTPGVDVDQRRLARRNFMGSSCGLCGKRSRDALALAAPPLLRDGLALSYASLESFAQLLSDHQESFAQTGGLHAAALLSTDGPAGQGGYVQAEFEDIGRHNALDKLVGDAVLKGLTPLRQSVAFLSSRSSYELVQKAAMAGIAVLATIGGPSSLAIEAARDHGMTLVGFVRPGRMNVYSGEWRLHS